MFCYNNLYIRKIEKYDLEKIRTLRNNQSTWEMLSFPGMISKQEQEEWFNKISTNSSVGYYVVFNDEYDFIGIIRTDEIDHVNRSIRVGADVIPELRGQGFGTSIYKLIKKYFFDYMNMNRIWLAVLDTNNVGLGLYKKQGFVVEGKYREAVFRNGKYIDYTIMSILKSEFEE